MRSSKNRSRSKGNRNRSVGNIVNRVFDSSGPEGKVRGTPQQIIDKYNQLARDAQLSNDRVATENFQQHAEHYTRMLAEAQREQEAKREQQQQHQQQQNHQNQQNRSEQNAAQKPEQQPAAPQKASGATDADTQPSDSGFNAVIEAKGEADSGLVETPESAPKPKRSRSRRSTRKPDADAKPNEAAAEAPAPAADAPADATPSSSPEAAE